MRLPIVFMVINLFREKVNLFCKKYICFLKKNIIFYKKKFENSPQFETRWMLNIALLWIAKKGVFIGIIVNIWYEKNAVHSSFWWPVL